MKVLPTLQIQNGCLAPSAGCDSLETDPFSAAVSLLDRGCKRICLLDVDAARSQGHNRELISRIMRRFRQVSSKVCIQVGGGIRSSDQAQFFLDEGATWLLVGTILHRSPLIVDQLLGRFREQLTAAIDARGGKVQASGWSESSRLSPQEAAIRIREQGFRRILFSDIPDGSDNAPDFPTAARISEHGRLPLLMGGSIRSLEHIAQASAVPGIQGVLVDSRLVLGAPDLFDAQAPACG